MELLNQGLGWGLAVRWATSGRVRLNGSGVMVGNFTGGGERCLASATPTTTATSRAKLPMAPETWSCSTKVGSGNQNLSGTNTYTGRTTVNAGTLEVDGSINNSGEIVINRTFRHRDK